MMDGREFLFQHERKDLLCFLTCGSVDDGKSTLIGRLLHDSKNIYDDHLAGLQRDTIKHGSAGTEMDFSLLLDGLRAEREQGITIDVAYRYFSTPRRKFIIADTPGHEQYTRNMATGASNSNLAIILVDARHGILAQTKRHSFIVSLLGIQHLVLAVNKMDAVDYDERVYEQIKDDFASFAAKLRVSDLHVVPISALKGDNVVERGDNMPWFKGGPLLDYLENVHIASDYNLIDFRFPVQYVLRPDNNFRGYCGTVSSGIVRPGDEVIVLPTGQRTRIERVVTYDGDLKEAFAPQSVTLTISDQIDVSRGAMFVHPNNVPTVSNVFDAMVVWMAEEPMASDGQYFIKHTTNLIAANVERLHYRINVNTLHREGASQLELNEIGRCTVSLTRPLAFDPYASNRATGAFVIIDRLTNGTVGAGMILARRPNELLPAEDRSFPERNLSAKGLPSRVTSEARAERFGHSPVTLWLTGFPRSGKTTIANELEHRLFQDGYSPIVIDSNRIRRTVNADLGFSGAERSENLRRAAGVARLLNDSGQLVIAAFVSPYKVDRKRVKTTIGEDSFLLVHVNAPISICKERDTDGLYEKAEQGDIDNFTGVSAPYETPDEPDLVIDTSSTSPKQAVDEIMTLLEKSGFLQGKVS